jgi:hypothetical protein
MTYDGSIDQTEKGRSNIGNNHWQGNRKNAAVIRQ